MAWSSAAWSRMFVAAAVFNFAIGVPILVARRWSYDLAYSTPLPADDTMTLKFWGDFGFAVVLIGVGYYLVSRDVGANRGLVWLGIGAKLFDVVVLTYRWATDLANPIVLLPALIDGIFVLLFAAFLYQTRLSGLQSSTAGNQP
ncbi:MAG TPA: hypothetical protein VH482_20805 [Thermomicrobiales bacterium]|jgi:hypothetical protein